MICYAQDDVWCVSFRKIVAFLVMLKEPPPFLKLHPNNLPSFPLIVVAVAVFVVVVAVVSASVVVVAFAVAVVSASVFVVASVVDAYVFYHRSS